MVRGLQSAFYVLVTIVVGVRNMSPERKSSLNNTDGSTTEIYRGQNGTAWNFEAPEYQIGNNTQKKKYCYSSHQMSEEMKKLMDSSRYNVHTVPSFENGKPLKIKLALTVLVFRDMKEVDMTYTVDFFLRTKWTDTRLKNSLDCIFTMTMGKKHPAEIIWVPDTMIENAVTSYLHEVLTNNHKIDISPNGDVFWSTRVTAKAMCHMNLLKYPRDKQTCSVVLLSYTYTTDLVQYVWDESNPVSVMDKTLSQFDVTSFDKTSYNYLYAAGEYSILEAKFVFARRIGYYVTQVYIPCIFLVVLAGLSFWVDASATPARVALSLTTLLTIATIWSAANSNMPPVSYVKAIDIYFLTSFGFVLATLLEYIIVLNYEILKTTIRTKLKINRKTPDSDCNSFERQSSCKHDKLINKESLILMQTTDKEDKVELRIRYPNGNGAELDRKLEDDQRQDVVPSHEDDKKIVSNIDRVTKFLYPMAYIAFNVVYWYQLRD